MAASAPLNLRATVGDRSVADQGRFGEVTSHGQSEDRFKRACFVSGAKAAKLAATP